MASCGNITQTSLPKRKRKRKRGDEANTVAGGVPDAANVQAEHDADIFSLIKGFTKDHLGLTLTYLVLVLIATALSVVAVSKLTARFQKNVSDADIPAGYRALFVMMVVLLISFVVGYITDFLENRLFPMFVKWSEAKMLKLILEKNQTNPELDVDANVYRQIMLRTSSSASHVYQQLLYNIIPNGIVLLVMFTFLFKLNWRYGAVFLVIAVLVSALAFGSKNMVMSKSKEQETISKETEWRAFDVLFNMQLVVSKNMVEVETNDINAQLQSVCDDKIDYLQMVDNLGYLVQTASYTGVFIVFFLALWVFGKKLKAGLDKEGKDREAREVLTLVSVLMGVRVRLQNLTKSQISTVDSFGKYGHISEKIREIQNRTVEQGTTSKGKDSSVEFDNVHFHYGNKHVLKGVSLKVKSFETVVIRGQSGSGKSTLAKLCLRILEPSNGQVHVGHVRVQDYSLAALKRRVSYVNPDQGILNRTIRENIMYGCPKDAVGEKTKDAERMWTQFQGVFDGKTLDSRAGVAGGVELSTGQKQLVRLMNILVCGNNDVLILDEPCGGMDPKTKKLVLGLIDNIRKSRTRTILIITHDAKVGEIADRQLLMTNGVLVETTPTTPTSTTITSATSTQVETASM